MQSTVHFPQDMSTPSSATSGLCCSLVVSFSQNMGLCLPKKKKESDAKRSYNNLVDPKSSCIITNVHLRVASTSIGSDRIVMDCANSDLAGSELSAGPEAKRIASCDLGRNGSDCTRLSRSNSDVHGFHRTVRIRNTRTESWKICS